MGKHGPVFGPYEFIHSAYAFSLELGNHDTCDELFCSQEMVYYDGIYYANWWVFDERTFKDGRYQALSLGSPKQTYRNRN